MTRIYFREYGVKLIMRWIDIDGKKRQRTRKFTQTLNPWNRHDSGTHKTPEDIFRECRRKAEDIARNTTLKLEAEGCKSIRPVVMVL